ncbi:MAG: flagellar protein FliO/FliZ [Clostridia bacterium]|jgi:flagellar protein FliO/FliZ|nr:flagellar biosynthetic protein FliO [Clostridiales bacterium]MDK2985142.1 flagellar protein FliO/FliZ [Clostridia bacterium]
MDQSFWEAFLRVIIFLPLVAGLAYLVIKFGLTKKYLRYQGKNLKVIDQIALTPKATLNIVKVGDDYLLIGATENEITLLKEVEYHQEGDLEEEQPGFADFLKRFKKGGGMDE